MKAIEQISYESTKAFSSLVLDYLQEKENLKHFYFHYPKIENFKAQIAEKQKNFPIKNRANLVQVIQKQYQNIESSEASKKNIALLDQENTFTITTGHQLCLMTGPLYFIYKIASTIQLCEKLKANHPENNFVPIYWMASEDHDFEEISFFNLFNQKFQWKSQETGAVGKMSLVGLEPLIEDLLEKIGDRDFAPSLKEIIKKAYHPKNNLSQATRIFVNELFGKYGLIVLDADEKILKESFTEVIRADIFEQIPNQKVKETIADLEKNKLKVQINPRAINFFYLKENLRARIIKTENNQFHILNTNIFFTEQELQKEIQNFPERFSPNVVLRPLYQEMILPNLAYIGGGAELAYWLELKNLFDYFKISFPMVMLRNSVLVLDKNAQKKQEKFNLEAIDLFLDEEILINEYLKKETEEAIYLSEEIKNIQTIINEISEKAEAIEVSLKSYVLSAGKNMEKQIYQIESRLKKAQKQKHESSLNQIRKHKQRLFPKGKLQERHDNFINFYLSLGPVFIENLVQNLDPLSTQFSIFKV